MWKTLIKYGTKLLKMVKPTAKVAEEAASVGKSAAKETANVAKQEVKAAGKVAEQTKPEVVKTTDVVRKSDGARVVKKHYPQRTSGITYEGTIYDRSGKVIERSATYAQGSAYDRSATVITRAKTEFGGIVQPGTNQGQALRSTVTRIEASARSPRAEIQIFKGTGMPQNTSLNRVNRVDFAEKTVEIRFPKVAYGVERPGSLPWLTWN